ncbi:MAG: hypothetical protein DMF76_26160 [Acidobacteria bacterium]|nr:MAG: hypothetical protein DMF76_26160 [Acidobacteriota bacterium]
MSNLDKAIGRQQNARHTATELVTISTNFELPFPCTDVIVGAASNQTPQARLPAGDDPASLLAVGGLELRGFDIGIRAPLTVS